MMPFSPKLIGNPILPTIHGGMTGAFLETAAIVGVTRELGAAAPPKPIGLTINYLRPGRALDSYANVSIVKQGRRIVAFEARAWQDDPDKPIASTFGHFMLRATPPYSASCSEYCGARDRAAAPTRYTVQGIFSGLNRPRSSRIMRGRRPLCFLAAEAPQRMPDASR